MTTWREFTVDYAGNMMGAASILLTLLPVIGPPPALALGIGAIALGLWNRHRLVRDQQPLFGWGRWWWLSVGLGAIGVILAVAMALLLIL